MNEENLDSTHCSVYPIRTLRDIFELPTIEQMETCLEEMATAMKTARATADLINAAVECATDTPNASRVIWPDVCEWRDDGKGEVGADFHADGDEFLSVRVAPNPTGQQPEGSAAQDCSK
jgi:hypothetical protein